jgi:predicted DNA-binding protein (MmcQ/YjbR family)
MPKSSQPKDQHALVTKHIKQTYNTSPDYPWDGNDYAVFRHEDNNKWFALLYYVSRDKVDPNAVDSDDIVSAINLKISDPVLHDILTQEDGIIPSYHMNKRHWITVILDGTVADDEVFQLIKISYMATASSARRHKIRDPKEWIVPANPKYYDVIGAFEKSKEINWKQGAGINTGDTVYIYVGAPISAIMFKCKVEETDIPYDFDNGKLQIRSLMKIKLIKKYKPDDFTFERLKSEFGINAIRGPRGVPYSLSERL